MVRSIFKNTNYSSGQEKTELNDRNKVLDINQVPRKCLESNGLGHEMLKKGLKEHDLSKMAHFGVSFLKLYV